VSYTLTPDQVCAAFAESGAKLTVRILDNDAVLLEGSADALARLGALLTAQASSASSCGFQASPRGAGNAIFSPHSDLGLYIHRLPCDAHEDAAVGAS
jgi:hypothetical protein